MMAKKAAPKKKSAQIASGQPAPDRRQKIVQAAVQLFAEKGAPFSKLSDVAKLAGVPAPLIHYYYATVEDLHFDVIQFAILSITQVSAESSKAKTVQQSVREYVRAPFQWVDQNPGLASIIVYFYYLASCNPRFNQLNTMARSRGRERIEMMIYRGRDAGEFHLKPGKSTADAAYEIQAIISGYSLQYTTEARQKSLEDYLDRACESIFSILGCSNEA
jgi:AcrR family transcriptional regulator